MRTICFHFFSYMSICDVHRSDVLLMFPFAHYQDTYYAFSLADKNRWQAHPFPNFSTNC